MEAFLTFPVNAGSTDVALRAAPQLRATAKAPEHLQAPGTSLSTSANWQLSLGVAVGVVALAGTRNQGRRSSRSSIVKCRAVPSKEDVAKAKQESDLATWAAGSLKGSPQEAAMKTKAQAKTQAYEALKTAFEKGVSAAPVAAAAPQAAARPAASAVSVGGGSVPSAEEVAAAKQKADLISWAAKALAKDGSPQAAAMQAKAASKLQIYQSLKAAFDRGVPAAAPIAGVAAPQYAATAVSAGGKVPSQEEVANAKKDADLIVWAAKALHAKGSPQAAAMQAKADSKLQVYQSLKAAFDNGAPAAPAKAAPQVSFAAAAPQPAAGGKAPSREEVAKAKEQADLMLWAAKALAAKGSPQASEMKAKAQVKLQAYESLKSRLA